MATNAPAAERPVCWLLLFNSAQKVTHTTTERLICPGWETLVVPVSQPGTPGRDKRGSFCPGSGNRGCYQPGQKVPFFPVFLFSILFLFQLYFCISIKLMYWNSVCMISTNIYIYSYLCNICPR